MGVGERRQRKEKDTGGGGGGETGGRRGRCEKRPQVLRIGDKNKEDNTGS